MPDFSALRNKLLTIRRQTLVRMAGEPEEGAIDAGLLALAAKIQTALQAIDEEESREQ